MNRPPVVRALVVDDEKPARDLLVSMLSEFPEVQVVGTCAQGEEALLVLASRAVDLLFLDIQMPGLGGLEVARRLGDGAPRIVFVTAFDDFAVEAFELNALDYLLKPFPRHRLEQTLQRARNELATDQSREYARRMHRLLSAAGPDGSGAYIESFQVQTGGRLFLVPSSRIQLIEAADHYTRLWSDGLSHLILRAISSLEDELDPERFVRIHRTRIVNVDFVSAVRTGARGPQVELKDLSRHAISRGRKEAVPRILAALARRGSPPA